MRYDKLIDTLQNLIHSKPTQQALASALGIAQTAINGRAKRNSNFSDEEIEKIEKYYNVVLSRAPLVVNSIYVDYYPDVYGSCGGGAFALSETKEIISVPKSSFWEFSSLKKYSVINAVGDSMYPSIVDRDKLIIEHWENEQIKDNRVYVFCYKDEIFVKRLIKNIDEIIIKSDNPDPMYRPRYVGGEDMNNIIIVGQVVGMFRDLK